MDKLKRPSPEKLSQELLQTVFSHAGDGIFVSENTTIIAVNPRGCEMLGMTREEIIGLDIITLVPAEDLPHTIEVLQRMLTTKTVCDETTFYRKDGSRIPVEISGTLLSNGNIVGFVRDITRRKLAEAALQEAQAKNIESERALASFEQREQLARELHDGIGQVLGSITMQLEAVRQFVSQGNLEEALLLLSGLTQATQEAHHDLRKYIQDLKSSTPAVRPDFFAALERYFIHFEELYGFHVRLKLPATLPVVLASAQVETHLTYIIREAVSNAHRHSGQKQADVTISVTDQFVQAVIEDDGVGFDAQRPAAREQAAPHFGLKMMQERAGLVDGSVVVHSAPAKGTQIIVHLPRRLLDKEVFTDPVLVVDDHQLFVSGLSNMLVARGANVVGAARDGLEALEMTRALKPGLVLMDISMPRMNGIEATRLIRAEFPEIKVVILTTSLLEEDVLKALGVGAAGYLPKDISADEFMARLGEISRGEIEFSKEVAKQLLDVFARKKSDMAELSERQRGILRLVAQGLTYREIGDQLFLAERTIKYHMGEVITRLHLKRREDVEAYVRQLGSM